MARLPNGDRAIVPLSRVTDYLLNPRHPVGKHKARVFAAALGIGAGEAPTVQTWLLELARRSEADPGLTDAYGQRFVILGKLSYNGREALVRTAWILRSPTSEPEFLTAYVE